LPEEKLGVVPAEPLTADDHAKNNLPDVLARWANRDSNDPETGERERPRTAQSFCVPRAEIAEKNYDLSLNRYKEVVHEEVSYEPPQKILADLKAVKGGVKVDQCGGAKGSHLDPEKHVEECGARASGA
jgi:type I restriction enzyme M protein